MRRPTAEGTTGMVATQHPLAVDAALEMLQAEGTAADGAGPPQGRPCGGLVRSPIRDGPRSPQAAKLPLS